MTDDAKRMLAVTAVAMALGGAAAAQEDLLACPSQEQLEAALAGEAIPDGCQTLTVTVLDAEPGTVCAIDLAAAIEGLDEGLTGALGEALPDEWWVLCDQVGG